MKKAIILFWAVALVMVMAVPAFAVDSPTAPAATPDKTAALPGIEASVMECGFYSIYEADKLSEEAREDFIAAQKCLKEAVPEDGMIVKYFFYHIHVQRDTPEGLCQHIFDIGEFEKVIVKQYMDDEWVELAELGKRMEEPKKVEANSDGTVTVGLETGPTAFFIKQ